MKRRHILTLQHLPALDKGINVVIQTFLNDFDGFFSVAFFIDCGGLVLQCFIYCEEMLHLVNDIIALISKEVKMRKDSIDEFKKGGREDLLIYTEKTKASC